MQQNFALWRSVDIPVLGRLGLAILGHVESPAKVVLAELTAVDLLREVNHGARRSPSRLVAEDDGKQRHVHLGVDLSQPDCRQIILIEIND